MKRCLLFLMGFLLLTVVPASAEPGRNAMHAARKCQTDGRNMNGSVNPVICASGQNGCNPEMRGRCGKMRGDWYGARQSVATASEALGLIQNYFAGQAVTVSGVIEKKWGYLADITDKSGVVVDRVLIDKRSGRIRSLY
ncbi:MAG: hypothetical protein PHY09_08560 [Desulfuromonadaceae bacterium]|nr:hypothetical protein [Desulfuromonadaceae bacterium]MDD5106821.1 hypothetical protein [Desulfuromonadaceae bacterium]